MKVLPGKACQEYENFLGKAFEVRVAEKLKKLIAHLMICNQFKNYI
jgi:hypothetical protein